MRLIFPRPPRHNLRALHVALEALAVPGFTGLSDDTDHLYVELPGREALEQAEHDALEAAVASYVFEPTWAAVRKQRARRLAEADWRIERAADQGRGLDAQELRAYRQQLRDVTNGSDPENPTWPTPPWAEGS